MKITLIYPGITESGFNNLKGNEGSWINHGLCSLSAILKKNGHKVSLIDLRILSDWDHFASLIKNSDADLFGITVMSVDLNAANQCTEIIKKANSKKPVVFGGAHPSIAPEDTLKNAYIDHVICGEGEITFLNLVNDLALGHKSERLIEGQRPELDELPFVDRELFSAREEPFVGFLKAPFVTIIAGRGCIYNCNYCQPAEKKIFGHKVRRRSVANVILELKELHLKLGFNSFMFHDDCLTEDKKWIEDFCAEYQKTSFKKQFVCQSRADLVCKNRHLIKMLKDIGLDLMIIGFESGSQRMLDFIGKGTRVEQNFEAAEICHKLGIKIWANYMLGLPGETKEEQRMTLQMIKKIRPYHCSPAYYTPHPGSRLFDYCLENDLSLIKKPEDYRRNTYEPKIKGIDYEYLKDILYESVSYGEDSSGRYGVKKVKYFLQKRGISIKLPKILSLNKVKDKISSAGRDCKGKIHMFNWFGRPKK
nr:B12-binding domain-containing radical SAM protein [Candidatus Omnitrophota bacterium]